jgi:hypothetical protein
VQRELFRGEGLVGDDVGVGEMGKAHSLMASVNGGRGVGAAGLQNMLGSW